MNVYSNKRNFSLLITQSGLKPGLFKLFRQLYRTVHKPTTPVSEAHEELLKVLEKYIQTLKDDASFSLEHEQKYMKSSYCHNNDENSLHTNMQLKNINCHQLYSKPNCTLHQNQVNTAISSLVSSLPSDSFTELGQDMDKSKITGMKFIGTYDPSTENQNLYRTTPTLEEFRKEHPISEIIKNKKPDRKIPKVKYNKKKLSSEAEDLEIREKNVHFNKSLCSYIQVCGSLGMVSKADSTFKFYRFKNRTSKRMGIYCMDIKVYNALLNCWAALGNFDKVEDIFASMAEDGITPNLQSCVAYLDCLARSQNAFSRHSKLKIEEISTLLEKQGKKLADMFSECIFLRDQWENVVKVLKANIKNFPDLNFQICHTPYNCELLEDLNDRTKRKIAGTPFIGANASSDYSVLTSKQLEVEANYFVPVKSVHVHNSISKNASKMRKCISECEERFKKQILYALESKILCCWDETKGQKGITIYPYLCAVKKDVIVKILLQEIRFLAETAEYFSPNINIMCTMLGNKVMHQYFISERLKGEVTNKIAHTHSKYMEYLQNPELVAKYTPREYWEYVKHIHFQGPTIDIPDIKWPYRILHEVGQILYEILLENLTFDINIFKRGAKPKAVSRPFYTTYEGSRKSSSTKCVKLSHEIRAHSKFCKMYREATLENIDFDVSMVPMVCPPRPWVKVEAGGLLMTSVPFIRLPQQAHQQNAYYNTISNEQFYPCFDSLNFLSLCPWIINKPVLDIIIQIFRSGGCEELDVPIDPEKIFNGQTIKSDMTPEEKFIIRREIKALKKRKLETGSLWYDCLYKLSIANHFRDTTFWFPHNLDFRGRVYPTPPHFNHLGSDLVRSILLFAEGKPLGPNGFDWLKIHLINCTGKKKRESNSERLRYANEIIEDILDSADNPFKGRQWWRTSDDPWQTLACSMEIAKVVRSPDPIAYVSHFPVHQDGSCNGLQHYAALGRDEFGAKEVNLFPCDRPQDVYTGVASLIEKERQKDAANGSKIAKALEGFVTRKVVKQTTMTFVYGVTEYGAKQQIERKLKDLEFPKPLCSEGSFYLMKQTFASIQTMFTATQNIQAWFTNSAELITKVTKKSVEWVTPLGLPVIQPYYQPTTISNSHIMSKQNHRISILKGTAPASYESTFEMYQLPNVRKQKNAFAPNFIHSLDSSHMMLTSLFCQREDITFVSVHDCYWTHPITVEIMNRVCRQQFVALHSQPILEDLSRFFLQKYLSSESSRSSKQQLERLRHELSRVPEKGSFNLNHVLESVYFFS